MIHHCPWWTLTTFTIPQLLRIDRKKWSSPSGLNTICHKSTGLLLFDNNRLNQCLQRPASLCDNELLKYYLISEWCFNASIPEFLQLKSWSTFIHFETENSIKQRFLRQCCVSLSHIVSTVVSFWNRKKLLQISNDFIIAFLPSDPKHWLKIREGSEFKLLRIKHILTL